MTNDELALFRTAFWKTQVKGLIVVAIVAALGVGMTVGCLMERQLMEKIGGTLVGLLFVGLAVFLVFHLFSRLPKRFAALMQALAGEPNRIASVSGTAYHSRLVSVDGVGAQWTIDIVVDGLRLSLMPGKRREFEALHAVLRARAPHATAA